MEQIRYTMQAIPNGQAGIRETLKIMSRVVKQYKSNPVIRELALRITAHLQQKNFIGEAAAIHHYVKEQIRYVKDIAGVETIQTPIQTLRLKAGDCDDKSTLAAALLESLGHPTRFLAVGFRPKSLSHVYVQTKIGSKWVGVETTEPVEFGWQPPNVKCVMVQHNK
jgi:transglutaminase-like putative cysteine protease